MNKLAINLKSPQILNIRKIRGAGPPDWHCKRAPRTRSPTTSAPPATLPDEAVHRLDTAVDFHLGFPGDFIVDLNEGTVDPR